MNCRLAKYGNISSRDPKETLLSKGTQGRLPGTGVGGGWV